MKKDRERLSKREQEILAALVAKYKDVIENKVSDEVTNAEKIKCWQKIEDEFHCHENVKKRTWKQLRKAWENMKMRKKRARVSGPQHGHDSFPSLGSGRRGRAVDSEDSEETNPEVGLCGEHDNVSSMRQETMSEDNTPVFAITGSALTPPGFTVVTLMPNTAPESSDMPSDPTAVPIASAPGTWTLADVMNRELEEMLARMRSAARRSAAEFDEIMLQIHMQEAIETIEHQRRMRELECQKKLKLDNK